jgi:hypothetical protein
LYHINWYYQHIYHIHRCSLGECFVLYSIVISCDERAEIPMRVCMYEWTNTSMQGKNKSSENGCIRDILNVKTMNEQKLNNQRNSYVDLNLMYQKCWLSKVHQSQYNTFIQDYQQDPNVKNKSNLLIWSEIIQ